MPTNLRNVGRTKGPGDQAPQTKVSELAMDLDILKAAVQGNPARYGMCDICRDHQMRMLALCP
jgi:hypothetical protein